MITNLKPYPAYKDSGVEWLGQVPAHWEVRKLRALFTKAGSGTTPSGDEFYGGDIPWVVTGDLNDSVLSNTTRTVNARAIEDFLALRLYSTDSLIIAMYGATIGKTAILGIEACTNQACCALAEPCKGVLVRFIQLAVISAKEYLVRQGSGGGQPNINSEIVHSLRIPVPPFEEQTAISRFLDWADTCIHKAIRARKRRIKLLEEYKQALIHQAVTGQIDVRTGQPYPAYKDFGVECLGKVPAHWEIRRLKQVCQLIYGDSLPTEIRREGNIQVYGSNGIIGTHSKANTKAPCIIIGRKGSFGKINFSFYPVFAIDTTYFIDERFTTSDLRWLYYLLILLNLDSISKDSTVPGLSREDAYEKLLPLPPLPEQTAIVEYLDSKTAKFDTAIAATRRSIELLKEYRTRLIADVVTGKLDVREAAASLPEESAVERGNMDEAFNLDEEADDGDISDAESDEIAEEDAYAD